MIPYRYNEKCTKAQKAKCKKYGKTCSTFHILRVERRG